MKKTRLVDNDTDIPQEVEVDNTLDINVGDSYIIDRGEKYPRIRVCVDPQHAGNMNYKGSDWNLHFWKIVK